MIAYANKCFEYASTKMPLSISDQNSFSMIITGSLSGLNRCEEPYFTTCARWMPTYSHCCCLVCIRFVSLQHNTVNFCPFD